MYSCTELEGASRRYLQQHFLDVVHHEEFLNLPETRLMELLSSDQIQVPNEEQVFEAVVFWVNWAPRDRAASVCAVLKHVRLALLSSSYLEDVVMHTEHVQSCSKCQGLVDRALRGDGPTRPRSQPQGIYVMGGRNSSDCQLKSMEKYDFSRDLWVPMVSLSVSEHPCFMTLANDLFLCRVAC